MRVRRTVGRQEILCRQDRYKHNNQGNSITSHYKWLKLAPSRSPLQRKTRLARTYYPCHWIYPFSVFLTYFSTQNHFNLLARSDQCPWHWDILILFCGTEQSETYPNRDMVLTNTHPQKQAIFNPPPTNIKSPCKKQQQQNNIFIYQVSAYTHTHTQAFPCQWRGS